MRVLVLGFGVLAREIIDQVKKFPEYGPDDAISIYHIFTNRNSLSYGKNLVVEIPDPHGDGYRTYNDGLQAMPKYATTVSNYKPWLLEEARNGSFHVIVDCTNKTTKSYELISELISNSSNKLTVIPANVIGVDATIDKLRDMIDGGAPWSPVVFSSELLEIAANAWQVAQAKMLEFHQVNRKRDIEQRGNPNGATSANGYSVFSAIPPVDKNLIDRFVSSDLVTSQYKKTWKMDAVHNCIIIEHDLLKDFFGWHHTEQLAAREFLDPLLQVESAKYIKYLSNSSTHVEIPGSDYVIEYVHSGTMSVTPPDGQSNIAICSDTMYSSFSYRPKINPPSRIDVHAGLETVIFTYRKMENAD